MKKKKIEGMQALTRHPKLESDYRVGDFDPATGGGF